MSETLLGTGYKAVPAVVLFPGSCGDNGTQSEL